MTCLALRRAAARLPAAALFLALLLPAANAAESGARAELRFDTLDISDGLSQNSVYAIAQGSLGLIWLGTDDGLHRFDGYEFTAYRKSGSPDRGLQSSSILALLADSRGDLWIGTHSGLHRMNTQTGDITPLRAPPDLPPAIIWDITEDSTGRIWFGGSNGAGYVDGDRLHLLQPPESAAAAPADVWMVRQDAEGTWWAFGENLAAHFETPGGEWRQLDVRAALGLAPGEDFAVDAAGRDGDGQLVLAVAGRLLTLGADNTVAGVAVLPPAAAESAPRDILADDQGNLWIALNDGGLLRRSADGGFAHYRHDPFFEQSLAADRLTDLFLDRNGLLWIGTAVAGVDRFDPATVAIRHYRHHPARENSLGNDNVWSFARAPGGPLWVSTEGGLDRIDPGTGEVTHYRHDDGDPASIASGSGAVLRFDGAGRLWIGAGASLDRHDPETGGFVHHVIPREDIWVVNFLPLGGSRFLVGTQESFGVFDVTGNAFAPLSVDTSIHSGLAYAYALALARAPDGTVWIGTNLGLLAWDGESTAVRDVMHGAWSALYGVNVQDVIPRAGGGLALATDAGLALLGEPGSAITWYTAADGLPEGTLYAVREDLAGKLWVSSNDGLLRIDPATREIDHFDRRDGLQSNEFNGGAALRDAQGRLYFGGINGFNVFDPRELAPRAAAPEAIITRVTHFDGTLAPAADDDGVIEIDWRHNGVTFDFMAADFSAPRGNRFQFRLLPLHEEWMLVEDDHRAAYADLSGGSYTFEVRAATQRGDWGAPARLSLAVASKPWRTWWAWTLYILAALGLLGAILRYQAQRLAAQQTAEYEMRQRQRVQSWHELATSLSRTLDVAEIFALLFKHVKRSVQAGFIALFEERDGRVELVQFQGEAKRTGLRAFATQQPAFIDSLKRTMRMHALPGTELDGDDAGLRDMQLLVIPAHDNTGRLRFLLAGRHGAAFDDEDVSRVAGYASQALIAIDKARLFADVQALATKDELTGLANRRHLSERAELEFQRCVRYRRPFAVLMIDFDHFKTINDRHGHDIGDRVLREAGRLFADQLRKFDVVARYGGEEFIMCLPETTLAQAELVAERLRQQVERLGVPLDDGLLQVTVSIGAASSEPADGKLQDVIHAADNALYTAKSEGRNRVHAGERLTAE